MKSLAADVALLGHPELIMKSDGEPAIVALKEAVRMERHERIILESSPVKESKPNGLGRARYNRSKANSAMKTTWRAALEG